MVVLCLFPNYSGGCNVQKVFKSNIIYGLKLQHAAIYNTQKFNFFNFLFAPGGGLLYNPAINVERFALKSNQRPSQANEVNNEVGDTVINITKGQSALCRKLLSSTYVYNWSYQ